MTEPERISKYFNEIKELTTPKEALYNCILDQEFEDPWMVF